MLYAARAGQLSVVQWLLTEGGALITETNELGDSALLHGGGPQGLSEGAWGLDHRSRENQV